MASYSFGLTSEGPGANAVTVNVDGTGASLQQTPSGIGITYQFNYELDRSIFSSIGTSRCDTGGTSERSSFYWSWGRYCTWGYNT